MYLSSTVRISPPEWENHRCRRSPRLYVMPFMRPRASESISCQSIWARKLSSHAENWQLCIYIPVRKARTGMFLLSDRYDKPRRKGLIKFICSNILLLRSATWNFSWTPAAQEVLEDRPFYDRLLAHRKYYSRLAGIDYEQLVPRSLRFVPFIETVEAFRADYEDMQRSMIYGDSLAFDDLLLQLKFFNGRIRLMGTGLDLEDVIRQFMEQHKTAMGAEPEQLIFTASFSLPVTTSEVITCQLTMHHIPKGWVFEQIQLFTEASIKATQYQTTLTYQKKFEGQLTIVTSPI